MSTDGVLSYLDLYMLPLRPFLAQPEVTDIYINRPGELWVETLGGRIDRVESDALDEPHLERLARQLAGHTHQGVSRRHPLLAATLPDGSRVQVVSPPATRGGMALAFRRHAATRVELESYGAPTAEEGGSPDRTELRALLDRGDRAEFLRRAVRGRLNILISGGTSTGKTTLLNTLLHEIPSHERLIFIEDTPELRMAHDNSIGLVAVRGSQGEAQVTPDHLLQAALRMRPDRIVLGELRGPEAFTFLRAINTGHPGSLSTIHADSPERAFIQLAMMSLQAGVGLSFENASQIVREMVDIVVQVERRGGERVISDIQMTNRPPQELRDRDPVRA